MFVASESLHGQKPLKVTGSLDAHFDPNLRAIKRIRRIRHSLCTFDTWARGRGK